MALKRGQKKCEMCDGTGFLPDSVTRQLVKPQKVKCSWCKGRGWIFKKRDKT